MRTSLNELVEIEKYVLKKYSGAEKILFEAKLLLDGELRRKVFLQKKIYHLLNLFYRKELKNQARDVYETLMINPEFQKEIKGIFKQE